MASVDTYALTSLDNVKEYLVGNVASDDSLLGALINRASDRIETIAGRQFKSRAQAQWIDGAGTEYLLLQHYPVTAVARVCIGWREVMSVTNTSTDAAWATVANDGTNVGLVVTGGVNDGSTDLALVTYATVTDMVAQIVATGSGWSSTVLNSAGAYPTTELKTEGALGCLTEVVNWIVPEEPDSNYRWDENSGRLFRAGGWPEGTENMYVAYTGGYATIPDDVEEIAIEFVVKAFQAREIDRNLKSERIADYAYTLLSSVEDAGYIQRRLMPIRRIVA